jgi:CBS domain-containing membrane protein
VQAATKRWLALTAADLMTSPVMTISQNTPLREAARLLRGSDVSGAPVVDDRGRCVSILSSTDFVTWAGKDGPTIRFIAPWGEMIDVEGEPDNEIRHYMTPDVVTVEPGTPVGELARKMVDAHIHRVVVVVDESRPCGIVSSTDVLAAIAREAREASSRGGRKLAKNRKLAH